MDNARSNAIEQPGMFHDPHKHMEAFADKPSIKHGVDSHRAQEHKLFMHCKI
jgi:hypothetical protein